MLKINDLARLYLGVKQENECRTIMIDMSAWASLYPNATPEILHKRQGDQTKELVSTDYDPDTCVLSWTPTEYDTFYEGFGVAEVRMVENSVVKKTKDLLVTAVSPSIIDGTGTVIASDFQAWLNAVISNKNSAVSAKTAAEGFMEDAEAWALGTRDGTDVPDTDPAYQNNAKYYAEYAASVVSVENVAGASAETLEPGSSATAQIVESAGHKYFHFGIPKGSKGDTGNTGATGATPDFQIGTVQTGAAGSSASASITGTAEQPVLNMTIPRGDKGETGETGQTGATGATPDISIGTVQTGAAGSSASASITGTPENPVLNMTIPRGDKGETGETGQTGQTGPAGPGVPSGGTDGQLLMKDGATDYNTKWGSLSNATGSAAGLMAAADKALLDNLPADLAIVESGDNATHNITSGQFVVWKGSLYKTSAAIASGDALSGSNLTAVSNGGLNDLGSSVNTLNSNIGTSKTIEFNGLHSATTGVTSGLDDLLDAELATMTSGERRALCLNPAASGSFVGNEIPFVKNRSNYGLLTKSTNNYATYIGSDYTYGNIITGARGTSGWTFLSFGLVNDITSRCTYFEGGSAPGNTKVYYHNSSVIINYQGVSTTHDTSSTLFTLPEGFRPSNNTYIPFIKNDNSYGIIQIATTGTAKVNFISSTTASGRIYFHAVIPISGL